MADGGSECCSVLVSSSGATLYMREMSLSLADIDSVSMTTSIKYTVNLCNLYTQRSESITVMPLHGQFQIHFQLVPVQFN